MTERTDWRIALALYGVLAVFVVGSFAAIAQACARPTAASADRAMPQQAER